jgi:farnesyl-diphosphate farnesyltransferase
MESGIADYAQRAALTTKPTSLTPGSTAPSPYLQTITEYDLYCHYVAGLVGEGLSRLFAASGKEVPRIGEQLTLANSMGRLLQKTNILREIGEDVDQGRYLLAVRAVGCLVCQRAWREGPSVWQRRMVRVRDT